MGNLRDFGHKIPPRKPEVLCWTCQGLKTGKNDPKIGQKGPKIGGFLDPRITLFFEGRPKRGYRPPPWADFLGWSLGLFPIVMAFYAAKVVAEEGRFYRQGNREKGEKRGPNGGVPPPSRGACRDPPSKKGVKVGQKRAPGPPHLIRNCP